MDEHFIAFTESSNSATPSPSKKSRLSYQSSSSNYVSVSSDINSNEIIVIEDSISSSNIDRPPWILNLKNQMDLPPLVRFHNEIIQFCRSVYPSTSQLEERTNTINEIEKICQTLWPTCNINVFGSQKTRILTCSSDIDISVLNVPVRDMSYSSSNPMNNNMKTELECLYLLANKLKDLQLVSYVEVISTAKVQIIKLDHRQSGLSMDICINNLTGEETGNFIESAVAEYPSLRYLTIVLKMFLVSTTY